MLFSVSIFSICYLGFQFQLLKLSSLFGSNISGYFTEDFPDLPPAFFDFVAEDLPFNNSNSILGTKVRVFEYGEEVEIVFQSANIMNSSQYHPMHFHGHSFWVVGSNAGDFDFELDPLTYNLVDPPFMNTANLPANGWLAIRFYAVNPGMFNYKHIVNYEH